MSLLRKISDTGVSHAESRSEKRSIILANYTSLILSAACVLIFLIIPQNHNLGGLIEMSIGVLIFIVPIFLNHFSLTNISRLYLCWLPPVLIILYIAIPMKGMTSIPVSFYDGVRFYLLAFSSIPYVLMDRSNVLLLIAGIIPGLLCILFCDFFFDLAGVGYATKGIVDNGYSFTAVR